MGWIFVIVPVNEIYVPESFDGRVGVYRSVPVSRIGSRDLLFVVGSRTTTIVSPGRQNAGGAERSSLASSTSEVPRKCTQRKIKCSIALTLVNSYRLIPDFAESSPYVQTTFAYPCSCPSKRICFTTKSFCQKPCGTSCTEQLCMTVYEHPNSRLLSLEWAVLTGSSGDHQGVVWVEHVLGSWSLRDSRLVFAGVCVAPISCIPSPLFCLRSRFLHSLRTLFHVRTPSWAWWSRCQAGTLFWRYMPGN